jgi:spermidine synthase
MPPLRSRDGALLLAFFLSGAAALGYELLWTRLLALSLGSESLGVLAALAGFFAGMALGAAVLHRRAETSPEPLRLFASLELVAAAFALASPHLLHALAAVVPRALGPVVGADQSPAALAASLAVAALVLLPGTFCLGATLPALARARRLRHPGDLDGRGLGRLYAANTAGATLGLLATVWLVLPALGYALGAAVPAALGAAAAAVALRAAGPKARSEGTAPPVSQNMSEGTPPAKPSERTSAPDLSEGTPPAKPSERPSAPDLSEGTPPAKSSERTSAPDLSEGTPPGNAPDRPFPAARPAPVLSDMSPAPAVDASRDPDAELLAEPWLLHLVAFGTGLAGVGLEVVGVQVLAQNLENTVYTFAHILAVYLVGTAAGAAIYQRLAARAVAGRPGGVLLALLALLGALVVPAAFALQASPDLLAAIAPPRAGLPDAALAELAVAALVFLPATIAMGALFAHIIGLVAAAGRGVGRAYALNTLGGALAPFVFGLWALPRLGYADGLYLVVYAYLLVFAVFGWFRRFHPALLVGGVVLLVGLTGAAPRSLALVRPEDGWAPVERRETLHGLVLVSQHLADAPEVLRATQGLPDAAWTARLTRLAALRVAHAAKGPRRELPVAEPRLQVGRHFRMGGARAQGGRLQSFGEWRMGHLCAMLAEAGGAPVRRALFLGVGTGATMGAALDLLGDARGDGVELIPEVLELLPRFSRINHDLRAHPRAALHPADARRFVVAGDGGWDLVLGDLLHPGLDGAGNLYAAEHFAAVRDRLRPGGLMCQWLPLYQLGDAELRTIVRTFLGAYPEAHAFLDLYHAGTPAIALVGRVPTADAPQLRLDRARLQALAARPGATIPDARDLLASYLADRTGLATWAGDGPENTDLRPRVVFDAPAAAYADDPGLGARNLAALLDLRPADPAVLLVDADDATRAAVRAHADAAARYLRAEILRADRFPAPPAALEQLVAAYEADPEFPTARGRLYDFAARDPAAAELVLPRMKARTPDEPRVYQALLRHYQVTGDRARHDALLEEALARFPQPPPSP